MPQNRLILILMVFVISIASVALFYTFKSSSGPTETVAKQALQQLPDGFVMPSLSGAAIEGELLFSQNCQSCHGTAATGSENGPPLVHRIYEPDHHGDQAFYLAVATGSRQHHWPFGDMPPVSDVPERAVAKIIAYVRTLQQANGI